MRDFASILGLNVGLERLFLFRSIGMFDQESILDRPLTRTGLSTTRTVDIERARLRSQVSTRAFGWTPRDGGVKTGTLFVRRGASVLFDCQVFTFERARMCTG